MHPPPATRPALRCLLQTRSSTSTATATVAAAAAAVPNKAPQVQCASIRHNSSNARSFLLSRPQQPTIPRASLPPIVASPHHRTFHSNDHPPPPGPFGATEATLLASAYKHVPEHGFTTTALAFGARDAGFPDISTSVLPDGEFGLIRWHLVRQKEALRGKAGQLFAGEGENGEEKKTIPEKIEMLVWERLMGNREVIGGWQQALAIMAHPAHIPASVSLLAQLADEIVYLSGDKAVDPSWYSSRGGVGAIYASAELFMTSDRSEGFDDTRQFLRNRMDEAKGLKRTVSGIGEWVSFNAMGAVNVARSLGVRI